MAWIEIGHQQPDYARPGPRRTFPNFWVKDQNAVYAVGRESTAQTNFAIRASHCPIAAGRDRHCQ